MTRGVEGGTSADHVREAGEQLSCGGGGSGSLVDELAQRPQELHVQLVLVAAREAFELRRERLVHAALAEERVQVVDQLLRKTHTHEMTTRLESARDGYATPI